MQIEYHRWYSPSLNHDMELNVYGHAGRPILVFPSMNGRFFEFENFGMVNAVERFIDEGRIRLFCVDSIDQESWTNTWVSPGERANRHNAYDSYIIHEVVPLIKSVCGRDDIVTTGCSMGGYHSMNFYLRHPDAFNAVIALSGCFQMSEFVGDYCDANVYFNSPLLYLPNCDDEWFLERYRQGQIIACCGQGAWEDVMRQDLARLAEIFRDKDIPAWCDFWGYDVNHDWPWWRVMFPYFLEHIV